MSTTRHAVVVHQPETFLRGFGPFLREVWRSRGLLAAFIRKDLKIRYRGSALGILWSLVRPLVQLLVFTVVMGLFLGFGGDMPDFGLFMFCGLILYGLLSEGLTNGVNSVIWGAPIVKKVAFRRELLPLASVGGSLVKFCFQVIVLCGAYLVLREHPNWEWIGLVMPALLIVVLFATGAAMLFSALNVYARDAAFIMEVGLLVLFWMTPVLYPWYTVANTLAAEGLPSWVFEAYMLNPMAVAVVAFQQAMWPGAPIASAPSSVGGADVSFLYFDSPFAGRLWLMVAVGLVFAWLCQRTFAKLQTGFATEL